MFKFKLKDMKFDYIYSLNSVAVNYNLQKND